VGYLTSRYELKNQRRRAIASDQGRAWSESLVLQES